MNQSRLRAAETKRRTTVQKFYSKISIGNDCWLWMGRRFRTGYGASDVSFNGKIEQRAHRAAYKLFIGSIPVGKYVCHHCDNPVCVRPTHLFLGDQKDNMRDVSKRGRWPDRRGEKNATHKLTNGIIIQIKRNLSEGVSRAVLARQFNVSNTMIGYIRDGKEWGHIKEND